MTLFFFENTAKESSLPSCNSSVEKDVQCTKIIDDQSSLSSTASLSTLSSQDSLVTCTAASTTDLSQTNRHVTFNDNANVYHEPHHYYINGEEADLWYTAQDYKQFKSIAASMAKMINKQAPTPFSRVLEKVYQECCTGTQQHDDEGTPSNKSPMRLMRQLFHGTQRSASVATACVGLEQRSCRTIARNRSQCRRELVFIVYTTQMQQRKENENDWMMMDDDYYLEQMRLQCERVSHRSRVFARLLAQAQWEADLE